MKLPQLDFPNQVLLAYTIKRDKHLQLLLLLSVYSNKRAAQKLNAIRKRVQVLFCTRVYLVIV